MPSSARGYYKVTSKVKHCGNRHFNNKVRFQEKAKKLWGKVENDKHFSLEVWCQSAGPEKFYVSKDRIVLANTVRKEKKESTKGASPVKWTFGKRWLFCFENLPMSEAFPRRQKGCKQETLQCPPRQCSEKARSQWWKSQEKVVGFVAGGMLCKKFVTEEE